MKMLMRVSILILLLTTAVFVGAQTQPNDSPAMHRARELIGLINSGDRAAATAYIKESYTPSFLRRPMDEHLGFISSMHDGTRGLEIDSVQEEKAGEVTLLLKSKLTGAWLALLVRVEADAPYKVVGIGRRPPRLPTDGRPRPKLTDAQIARELEAFVQKLADADVFSGTVLLAKNGQTLFKKAYGVANKDFNAPNRVDTKFNLGSMNKMFTSVAIAQLVERGKLSFDDPLSKFLPEFPTKEAAEKIRIRHLLTHTSGLGSYFNQKFMESSRDRFRTVDELMTLGKDEKPAFEPGTRWAYSNTGMLVLGKVIEVVTGGSYFDYIRENVYKPAGMIQSDSYELDLVNPNLAVGYDKEFTDAGIRFRNNIFAHVIRGGPAGGGYSTAEDLLRFAVALRSGKLVGEGYVKQLLSAKPEINSPGYGFGFQIDAERQIAGHGGGFPGISSNLDMFLEQGYTGVVLSNYSRGSSEVTEKIRELVKQASSLPVTSQGGLGEKKGN